MSKTIVIIGTCKGFYKNDDVSKEFAGKMLAMIREDGSIVIQSLVDRIRPLCYIGEGAAVSICKNVFDSEIELVATTEDGQQLDLNFEDVVSLCGVPDEFNPKEDSAAMCFLKAIGDIKEQYGRVRMTRLLTGLTSLPEIHMSIEELQHHGILRGFSQKEALILLDWLIEEKYLSYHADQTRFPVLKLTDLGQSTLISFDNSGTSKLQEDLGEDCRECGEAFGHEEDCSFAD